MSATYPRRWRDDFMRQAGKYEIPDFAARALMRHAATLQRLAEAQCNGDYPADNGERPTLECAECATHWAPASLNKAGVCPDCRATARAKAVALPDGWRVETAGDPRGAVVKLVRESDGLEIGVPS